MNARVDMTVDQAADFHSEVERVLKNMITGLSLKHGSTPPEACLAGIETLTGYMSSISPHGIAKYLAALAWVMREKAHGGVSQAACAELERSIGAINAEVAALVSGTEGQL